MKLPDWAHFCERCGARLDFKTGSADPLEQAVLDDTSSLGPLWSEADGVAPADEPRHLVFEEERQDDADQTEFMSTSEVLETTVFDMTSEVEDLYEDGADSAGAPDEPMMDGRLDADATRPQGTVVGDRGEDIASELEAGDAPEPSEAGGATVRMEELPAEPSEEEDEAPAGAEHEEAEEALDESDEVPQPERGAYEHGFDVISSNRAVIDVGEDDTIYGVDPALRHAAAAETWRGRTRSSERRVEEQRMMPMTTVAIVAAVAIVLGFLVAFFVLGGRSSESTEQVESSEVSSKRASQREAAEVIAGLDGWWKTNRTFDGRYWHIQDALMETYAADGVLAGQVLIDTDSVERMSAGPGGIEGEGYYLRGIAYYLVKDDPDTLHAINTDGTADEDGNLVRTDPPAFMGGGSKEGAEAAQSEPEQADSSEYMLPDSATRVYDVSELEGMSDHDLFVARNEIYARHGYVFEAGELSDYFASKSWYHPAEVFNEGDITDIERQNVSLILSIEQSRGSQYV